MDRLWQDIRYAIRMFAKNPGFTLAAVLTLALGIAANATVFGFMNGLLLRPYPLLDLDRLMMIWERHPQPGAPGGHGGGEDQNPLAVADFLDLRTENPGLESVAAYRYRDFVMTDTGEPERIRGNLVTPGYFETLGLSPVVGRTFLAEEGVSGQDAVVVLSHGFWQRRFGADPSVIGQTLVLGGRRHIVVGVTPQGLNFPPGAPEMFVPLAFSEAEKAERGKLSLFAVGRLRDSLGRRGAQAALDGFSARLAQQYPDTNTARTHYFAPLRELETGFITPYLLLFEGAAAFVLLIACANVAGLLIARGVGREREMALRVALGAGRSRIVRQLLTEGFLLSTVGAAAALWFAQVGFDLIRTSAPPDYLRWIPGWSQIRLDARTFAFTLGLAIITTLAFGLLPALRAARADLIQMLKAQGRSASSPLQQRLRGALVSFQVTLALVLVAGAVFMTRGFLDLINLYQGYDPERVVTLRLRLPEWKYPEKRGMANFFEQVVRGIEKMPSVESAGVVSQLPADLGPVPRTSFLIEGRPLARPQEKPTADFQTISPSYLRALRVAVQRGRALTDADGAEAPPVALVSASLAERFWSGEDPVGRRIRIGDDPWRTVVGVVADVKQYWFDREPRPTLYVSYLQSPRRDMFLVIRSPLDSAAVVALARDRVREADPEQPVDGIRTMAEVISDSASLIRLAAALIAILGFVALSLAAVGLYGAMAEHVARRNHEIGIRLALGAREVDVLRLVVGQAAWLVGIGLALGLLGAVALGRLMGAVILSIIRTDFAGLAAVAAILAAVAFAAVWLPARRATRVDPLVVLREE